MSGVKNLLQAKTKGVKQVDNNAVKAVRSTKGFGTNTKGSAKSSIGGKDAK